MREVVFFKRDVYRRALQELSELLPEERRSRVPRGFLRRRRY